MFGERCASRQPIRKLAMALGFSNRMIGRINCRINTLTLGLVHTPRWCWYRFSRLTVTFVKLEGLFLATLAAVLPVL